MGKYFNNQDIEVCVLKLKSTFFNACIMTVYRAPSGNCNLFLNRLDDIIKTLYKVDLKLIIYGDINVDYLTDHDKKRQLVAVFLTYIYHLYYISPLDLKFIPVLQQTIYLLTPINL